MSRIISDKYFVWLGSMGPPPPKHPQSMLRPRAQAWAIAMINANMIMAPNKPEIETATPKISNKPSPISSQGRTYPRKFAIAVGNNS